MKETDERVGWRSVRANFDPVDSRAGELFLESAAPFCHTLLEREAHPPARGIDEPDRAGLGVLEGHEPERLERQHARVDDLAGDDVVLRRRGSQGLLETFVEKVGDHEDHGAALLYPERILERRGEVRPSSAATRLRLSGRSEHLAHEAERVTPPLARGNV